MAKTSKDDEGLEGFTCECGEFNPFGVYVMAHWYEALIHTCDCGRRHTVRAGKVTLIREKK